MTYSCVAPKRHTVKTLELRDTRSKNHKCIQHYILCIDPPADIRKKTWNPTLHPHLTQKYSEMCINKHTLLRRNYFKEVIKDTILHWGWNKIVNNLQTAYESKSLYFKTNFIDLVPSPQIKNEYKFFRQRPMICPICGISIAIYWVYRTFSRSVDKISNLNHEFVHKYCWLKGIFYTLV